MKGPRSEEAVSAESDSGTPDPFPGASLRGVSVIVPGSNGPGQGSRSALASGVGSMCDSEQSTMKTLAVGRCRAQSHNPNACRGVFRRGFSLGEWISIATGGDGAGILGKTCEQRRNSIPEPEETPKRGVPNFDGCSRRFGLCLNGQQNWDTGCAADLFNRRP